MNSTSLYVWPIDMNLCVTTLEKWIVHILLLNAAGLGWQVCHRAERWASSKFQLLIWQRRRDRQTDRDRKTGHDQPASCGGYVEVQWVRRSELLPNQTAASDSQGPKDDVLDDIQISLTLGRRPWAPKASGSGQHYFLILRSSVVRSLQKCG